MPKIDNSNAPTFEIPGVTFIGVAAPSRGGTKETAVWRAKLAPNVPGQRHHMTREEIIIAVSGEGILRIGDETETLRPGDAFAVPAFTDFVLESAGDEEFEVTVVLPVGGRGVIGNEPSFVPA